MEEMYTLSCPQCGGKLEISTATDQLECLYCGTEHKVKRQGEIISLSPLFSKLDSIENAASRSANELAYKRVNEDVNKIKFQIADIDKIVLVKRPYTINQLSFMLKFLTPLAYLYSVVAIILLLTTGGAVSLVFSVGLIIATNWGKSEVRKRKQQIEILEDELESKKKEKSALLSKISK